MLGGYKFTLANVNLHPSNIKKHKKLAYTEFGKGRRCRSPTGVSLPHYIGGMKMSLYR